MQRRDRARGAAIRGQLRRALGLHQADRAVRVPPGRPRSLDLWERVAREAHLKYEVHWVKSVGDLIDALRSGKADVAIAGASDQKVVGRLFERQNYGIGLPDDSPLRKTINGALLHMREDGVLDELNTKWFGDQD